MNKMVVIFENLEEVHLGKDVGQLPYALAGNSDLDITIMSTMQHFQNAEFEDKVSLKFFPNAKIRLYLNILQNIKDIDVLMVFHGGKDKFLLFVLAKILNPKIKTYIKLDMGELFAKVILQRNGILRTIYKKMLHKFTDVFTVETKQVFELIKNDPMYQNKLYYLPNGFYASIPYDFSVPKEKIILTVGRLGSPQKNNNLLLETISRLDDLKGYKFYFAGPVSSDFQKRVDVLLLQKPHLKDNIVLMGNITDKSELYHLYKRSEIICFTSLYEGFSLAMIEALYFGCYLLSTNLAGAFDLTDDGKYGAIVTINNILLEEPTKQFFEQSKIKDIQTYIDNALPSMENSSQYLQSIIKFKEALEEVMNNNELKQNAVKITACNIYKNFNWDQISIDCYNILSTQRSDND